MTARSADEIWAEQSELAHRLEVAFREWARGKGHPATVVLVAHAMAMAAMSEALVTAQLANYGGATAEMKKNIMDSRDLTRHALDYLDKFIGESTS